MRQLALVVIVAACSRGADTGPTLDTGWFRDTGTAPCPNTLVRTQPTPGSEGWFRRDALQVVVAAAAPEVYVASLWRDGIEVSTSQSWSDDGLSLEVVPDALLAPSTSYLLRVSDCQDLHDIPFTTSPYGLPLEDGPGAIIGQTYAISLSEADWLEPVGFATVIALYLNAPILIGVEEANPWIVDLLGAQGYVDSVGQIRQTFSEPTWDFPAASFEDAPYFETNAALVNLAFSGVEVPITSFFLSGTFAADGTTFAGGRVSGLGDTRHMGGLIDRPDDPNAICELAATMTALCEPCPDGEPYCLSMAAVHVTGRLVPDLVLRRVTEEQ